MQRAVLGIDDVDEEFGIDEDFDHSDGRDFYIGLSPPGSVLGAEDSEDDERAAGADMPEAASCSVSPEASALDAFKRCMLDAINMGFYQADYMTKMGEVVGDLFSEQAIGVGRLRRDVDGEGGANTEEELHDVGRRMLIRLETNSNRASLKKLSEMVFQMLKQHECYQSHHGMAW